MASLEETINQAISDFDDIEKAIEEKGVDVPYDTNTSQYGNLIRSIPQGGVGDSPIKSVVSPDADGNTLDIYSMESGTYIFEGKFRAYPDASGVFTFSSGQLVAIRHGSVSTVAQIFYPPNNTIQYLDIRPDEASETGYSYTRKDAKLIDMESVANKTTTIDENSDDSHYPSAKAVEDRFVYAFDLMESILTEYEKTSNKVTAIDADSTNEQYPSAKATWEALGIKRLESLDTENMKSMRDIESGYYLMTGYFEPYPNSNTTVILDTSCVSVARVDEGSHLMVFSPLNFKIRCYEILVDDTAENGFVFNSWRINLLDLEPLPNKVETLENQTGDIKTALDTILAIQNQLMGVSE